MTLCCCCCCCFLDRVPVTLKERVPLAALPAEAETEHEQQRIISGSIAGVRTVCILAMGCDGAVSV